MIFQTEKIQKVFSTKPDIINTSTCSRGSVYECEERNFSNIVKSWWATPFQSRQWSQLKALLYDIIIIYILLDKSTGKKKVNISMQAVKHKKYIKSTMKWRLCRIM